MLGQLAWEEWTHRLGSFFVRPTLMYMTIAIAIISVVMTAVLDLGILVPLDTLESFVNVSMIYRFRGGLLVISEFPRSSRSVSVSMVTSSPVRYFWLLWVCRCCSSSFLRPGTLCWACQGLVFSLLTLYFQDGSTGHGDPKRASGRMPLLAPKFVFFNHHFMDKNLRRHLMPSALRPARHRQIGAVVLKPSDCRRQLKNSDRDDSRDHVAETVVLLSLSLLLSSSYIRTHFKTRYRCKVLSPDR